MSTSQSSQPVIIQPTSMPENTTKPLPVGANNIYTAGIVEQQNQAKLQASLVGQKQNGGKKYRKSRRNQRGGATPVIGVQQAPSYDPNKAGTNANNEAITKLSVSAQNNAVFDNATTQGETAKLAAEQQAVYQGKTGGSRKLKKHRKSLKRGGSWPVWGCLSGGKKSKKNCKCKSKKHTKSCKHKKSKLPPFRQSLVRF